MSNKHYLRLVFMVILSFVSMYILMYAMVDRFANIYPNLNQFYMAGIMVVPMIIIELLLMGAMYHNKKLNAAITVISLIVFAIFWISIRQQAAISDRQFLKSMIPHHAGAILMCEKANVQDPGIKELCKNIIESQEGEIAQMKAKLKVLGTHN